MLAVSSLDQPPRANHSQFASLDDFNQALADWNLDFRQQRPGDWHSSVSILQGPGVVINRISLQQNAHQRGAAPAGMVSFGLLGARSPRLNWCGEEISDQTLERFETGAEFDCLSDNGFDVVTISVDEVLLAGVAEEAGLQWHGGSSSVYAPPPHRLAAIRCNVEQAFRHAAVRSAESCRAQIVDGLCMDLCAQLLLTTSSQQRKTRAFSGRSRRRARDKALPYMQTHCRSPLSVGELCQEIGVSWRLLDYAFKDQFGVGPKTYLSMLRLDGLRMDLLAAAPDQTITRLATDWGYTHFGQLARDYRKLFGESPSDTLLR
jgi:AraC family ethanolamine operon transcriptional activator